MSQHAAFTDDAGGLSALVRERTRDVHRAAERAGFIADLLRGRATIAGYALFLRNLHPVYVAMEAVLVTCAKSPLAGVFADSRLHRAASLEADLRAIAGTEWVALPVLPEAVAYAAAIKVAARDEYQLSGHAYARYLGDLSGGQILKPLLTRSLELRSGELAFYDFPDYADLAEPKLAIRRAIDTVPASSPSADAFCAAAVQAFARNIALSNGVQAAFAST